MVKQKNNNIKFIYSYRIYIFFKVLGKKRSVDWSAFSLYIPFDSFDFFRLVDSNRLLHSSSCPHILEKSYTALGVCDNTQYTCYPSLFFLFIFQCVEAMQPQGRNAILSLLLLGIAFATATTTVATSNTKKIPSNFFFFCFDYMCACILFPIEDWCSCQQNQFHQQMFTSNSCMSREFHQYIPYMQRRRGNRYDYAINNNVLAKQNETNKQKNGKNIAIVRDRIQIFQLHTIYFNKF